MQNSIGPKYGTPVSRLNFNQNFSFLHSEIYSLDLIYIASESFHGLYIQLILHLVLLYISTVSNALLRSL